MLVHEIDIIMLIRVGEQEVKTILFIKKKLFYLLIGPISARKQKTNLIKIQEPQPLYKISVYAVVCGM